MFESERRALSEALSGVGADVRLVGELPRLLGVANVIRLTRNEAGHPVRLVARRDEALNLMAVFPHLAETVFGCVAALEQVGA